MVYYVAIDRSVFESILIHSKASHPSEGILLLRGRIEKDKIVIHEVVIPPFAIRGHSYSSFPLNMLPIDFSIVGTAHSHPSGILRPSVKDLNNFYSKIMIIATHPYGSEQDMAIFDRAGNILRFEINDSQSLKT